MIPCYSLHFLGFYICNYHPLSCCFSHYVYSANYWVMWLHAPNKPTNYIHILYNFLVCTGETLPSLCLLHHHKVCQGFDWCMSVATNATWRQWYEEATDSVMKYATWRSLSEVCYLENTAWSDNKLRYGRRQYPIHAIWGPLCEVITGSDVEYVNTLIHATWRPLCEVITSSDREYVNTPIHAVLADHGVKWLKGSHVYSVSGQEYLYTHAIWCELVQAQTGIIYQLHRLALCMSLNS